ncbi:hypothetical protein DMENIID0001_092510 [Sergentomyia squamirostris]
MFNGSTYFELVSLLSRISLRHQLFLEEKSSVFGEKSLENFVVFTTENRFQTPQNLHTACSLLGVFRPSKNEDSSKIFRGLWSMKLTEIIHTVRKENGRAEKMVLLCRCSLKDYLVVSPKSPSQVIIIFFFRSFSPRSQPRHQFNSPRNTPTIHSLSLAFSTLGPIANQPIHLPTNVLWPNVVARVRGGCRLVKVDRLLWDSSSSSTEFSIPLRKNIHIEAGIVSTHRVKLQKRDGESPITGGGKRKREKDCECWSQ